MANCKISPRRRGGRGEKSLYKNILRPLRSSAVCFCFLVAACSHAPSEPPPKLNRFGKPYKEGVVAPAWVDKIPGNAKGKLYSVGYSPPTYWPQDAINAAGYSGPTFKPDDALGYAGDNAIDNLAASLRAHVQAYTLLVENGSGLSVDQFSQTEDPDDAFKDIVKKGAKIEATWVDKDGARPGDPPGAVWALASIDVQSTKGGVNAVENQDLGPALDKKGNAPTDEKK